MNVTTATILAIVAISAVALRAADEVDVKSPNRPEKPVTLAPAEAADTALLQGKWEGVEVGKEDSGKCTLMVVGNKLDFQGWNKAEWYKGTFTLPKGTDPKQLEGAIAECPFPEMVGKKSPGIYKIENGKLTLAAFRPGSAEIPKAFQAEPGLRMFEFTKVVEAPK